MIDPSVARLTVGSPVARHLSAQDCTASREQPITLPPIGWCPRNACLTTFLYDDSGSVVGGNDCVGCRYYETEIALSHACRRYGSRRQRVAIMHFDRATGFDARPTSLDRKGLLRLKHSLKEPRVGVGTSELGPALEDAERLALAHPGHELALCVLSDFELMDGDVDAVLEKLCNYPGSVHAVVLRSEPPPVLEQHGVKVTRVRWDSEPGEVARAVLAALSSVRKWPL